MDLQKFHQPTPATSSLLLQLGTVEYSSERAWSFPNQDPVKIWNL